MKILLTNDDGIGARGLSVLSEAVGDLGSCQWVAPSRNQSGGSSALTLHSDIVIHQLSPDKFAIDGTPADCTHLACAIENPICDRPDIVLSGINDSANLGDDVLYSGTVGATFTSSAMGITSVAFSVVSTDHSVRHWDTAGRIVADIVRKITQPDVASSFAGVLLSVNIPDVPFDEVVGMRICALGRREQNAELLQLPGNPHRVRLGRAGTRVDVEGCDFAAVEHNYVSITPLQWNMTCAQMFAPLEECLL